MRNYCTLFNMAYAAKGLALYQGLEKHSSEPFTLIVLPMDQETYTFLQHLQKTGYQRMEVLAPHRVLTERFVEATKNRSIAYKCFTAGAWLMHYLIDAVGGEITYLDADLGFFSDPEKAHEQIGPDASAAVHPHRFLKHDEERLRPSGLFNVGWVTFRNDRAGMHVLNRWKEQCLAKCDAESCGDQRYLDEWPEMLGDKLHIFQDYGPGMGVGVAPWNAARYMFSDDHCIADADRPTGWYKVVFYHFHELKRRGPNDYFLTGYKLPDSCVEFIYAPYIAALERNEKLIEDYKRITC